MAVTIVQYRTQAERADENQALVERVFGELAATRPARLRYASFRLGRRRELRARGRRRHRRRQQPADRRRPPSSSSSGRSATAARRARSRRATLVGAYGFAPEGGAPMADGDGTAESPWVLTTPSGGSEYTAYRDETADPPALVVQVGKTQLRYHLRVHRRSARHARGARRLGAARERRRAEAGGGRDGRGLGARRRQPGRRLVRAEEGTARSVRQLRAAGAGGSSGGPRSSTTRATTACARLA